MKDTYKIVGHAIETFSTIHIVGEGEVLPYSMEKDKNGKLVLFYMKGDERLSCFMDDNEFKEV